MTKMRVHELAKELGLESKELIDILSKKKVEVKGHMSSVEDEVVAAIRAEHGKVRPAKEEKKEEQKVTPKPAETAKSVGEKEQNTEPAPEAAPKKKTIMQVFRPQNSKSAGRMQNNRPGNKTQMQRGGRPGQQQRPQGQGNAQGMKRPGQSDAGSNRSVRNSDMRRGGDRVQTPKPESRPRIQVSVQTTAQKEAAQRQMNMERMNAQSQLQERISQDQRRLNAERAEKQEQRNMEQPKSAETLNRPQTTEGANRSQNTERTNRPVRERADFQQNTNRDGRNQSGERFQNGERQNRGERNQSGERVNRGERNQNGERTNRGERFQNGNGGRQDRNERGGRSQGGERDGRGFNKDGRGFGKDERTDRQERNGRGGYGERSQGRNNGRRDDRDSMAAPMLEQQKSQRNKGKDKEKDYKKKELRDAEFENKGKKGKMSKPAAEVKKPQPKPVEVEEIKQIVLPEVLTIKELADKMKIVPSVIIKKLFMQGKIVTVNQEIDYDTAEEIAMEFEILCEKEEVVDVIEELLKEEEEDESTMEKRPPVVCVMGHVDHGKTSLLDAIRHTNVIDREAGGITQHIGAYMVEINGEQITFLDTPGHEAFTAMRMRGANSTDIAILVVAADDGVMPQTIEAINHAKAAGVEIIVAVNKIDKPSANVDRVKQEMTEYGLIAEDWGGSTVFVPVSARTGEGIQELLEMVLLTAEVMELKANPNRAARGLVIEAQLDKGKGPVATVLVQKGILHVGDAIAAGSAHGKVRAMMDDKGRRVKEAGPSTPVEILGLGDVPNAGEVFVGCATEKEARNFAETFISQNKVKLLDETKSKMSLDDLFTQIKEGSLKELNIVVKADVQGSVEALKQSLLKLSNEEVVIKIIHGGVGAINESDVSLASASNAIIIGFNVRPDATAKEIAEREGVDLRLYRVIYNAIEDVEAAMKGMLDPVFEEKILGHAEVRQTFKASGVGTIAGSYVQDGTFERNCSVRLTRDGVVIFDGPLASLKRFKDDVKEVRAGYECGFVFENFNDIKEGDLVEAYKMVEVERK